MNPNTTASTGVGRYLQFNLGPEVYAIPLLQVREVIGVPETTPIPFTPPHFLGMMNLRGQVISVIDLRKKLNIKPLEKIDEMAVIILDLSPIHVGVVVDSVNRVLSLEATAIQETPEIEGGRKVEFIRGVTRVDEKLTAILDVAKLLNFEDLKVLQTKRAA